jgi:hypothetical protein
MATDKGGGKGRMMVLIVVLLAAVGVFAWYQMKGAGGSRIDSVLMSGDLLGKPLEDATKAFGAEPAAQTNPDPASTATLYIYTVGSRRISVQVRAGKITRAEPVDAAGNVIPFDPK